MRYHTAEQRRPVYGIHLCGRCQWRGQRDLLSERRRDLYEQYPSRQQYSCWNSVGGCWSRVSWFNDSDYDHNDYHLVQLLRFGYDDHEHDDDDHYFFYYFFCQLFALGCCVALP